MGPISTDSPEFEAAEKGVKEQIEKIHEQQRNTFC
jgi:hypothetical protein